MNIDVSDVASKPTAKMIVTYGDETQSATVDNNIIRLGFDTLATLTTSNESSYPVTGTCNSNLSGQVTLTVVKTNRNASEDCQTDNTFSLTVDATGSTSNPVAMTLSHGGQTIDLSVSSDIEPLNLASDILPILTLANAATYTITGACDSSITTPVSVTVTDEDTASNNVSGTSPCTSDAFSVELDLSGMASSFVTVLAEHGLNGLYTSDHQLQNNIVPLFINELTEVFNLLTAADYTVSGRCDASIGGNVTITIDSNLSENTPCQNNHTFSVDVDATDITEATFSFRAAYGGKNFDSNVIDNNIKRLSITQPQTPFNSSTAVAYNVTGVCDASLSGSSYVVVSIQNTSISAQGDCANNNTYSVDLAASSVGEASSITIEVTYGGKTKSSQPISNSIVTLSLNDLTLLNSSTAKTYEVTGKCDSSLSDSAGDVTVSVVETAASQTSPCSGDTFSVNLDLSAVTSDSYEEITIRAEYGGLNVQETVTNNITELAIDSNLASLTEANKGVYTVSGKCDPSLVGNLSIVVGQPDTTAVLVPCANDKTFETQIDVSGVTYNPATIRVTQGTGLNAPVESRTVDNEILIPLDIDPNQPNLTEANKSAYRVLGACDASEYGSNITVKIGDPETAETPTTCHASSNTFDVEVNASGVVSNTATITATHGTSPNTIQATRNVTNNVLVSLSIDEAALSDFNLKTAASYRVEGKCDFSLIAQGSVTVQVVEALAITGTANCASDNTFSVDLDAVGVPNPNVVGSLTFQASYAGQTITTSRSILNEIVRLNFSSTLPALNLSNASSYPVMGKCDVSLGGSGTITIGSLNLNENREVSTTFTCNSSNTFSVNINASDVESKPTAKIIVTYGDETRSVDVANNIIRLGFDTPVRITASNESSYPVTGACNSNLSGQVTLTVVETNNNASVSCQAGNTFSLTVDATGASE